MRTVFADSGHWIALLQPVTRCMTGRGGGCRLDSVAIVTTQMALVEAFNHLSGQGEHLRRLAVQMARGLENDPNVEIIPQTDAQFRAAVERFASRDDQRWSLTDCASFLAMEERGITEALAYDRDFEQAGFVALLRQT